VSGHDPAGLGAYVLGVLDRDDQAAVDAHLTSCPACRREVDDLRAMEAALGEIPPEAFLDGPPPDADLLLQKTLSQVRDQSRQQTQRRRLVVALAAVALAVVALGLGAVGGRYLGDGTPVAAASTVPGTRTATATDPDTGAAMTVTVVPAAGWVRLHAEITGVAPGEQCRLYVVAADGSRQQAGSWLVSETGAAAGTTLDGSALMAPADVATVQAETYAGQVLVVATV
jgi:hypothetical protein